MFTYVCLGTSDIARSVRFYDPVMAALGQTRCHTPGEEDAGELVGWGSYNNEGAHEVALWLGKPFDGGPPSSGNGTMVALAAANPDQVQAVYAKAMALGGKDEGAPGARGGGFYGAYFRDLDGNKLAAFCTV